MLTSPDLLWAKSIQSEFFHPLYDRYYVCAEHHDGQFQGLGDALGTDCWIAKSEKDAEGRNWLRTYRDKGHENEDWFGWKANVLAPIDGVVKKINKNSVVNKPGIKGSGAASFILIERQDGVGVMVAHVREFVVKVGDKVKRGQPIAKVGNNGQSWHPHIHIGAWKGDAAIQIRFDQTKIQNR